MSGSMSEKQIEKIQMNLHAFEYNFGEVRIEKDAYHRGAFYVFYPEDSGQWIQYCPNIDYLNGWLYGCVQGALRCVRSVRVIRRDWNDQRAV